MPTDCSENLLEFSDCLSEIAAIVENQNVESVFILGDFNAHPGKLFCKELLSFCFDQNWLCADMSKLGENSDTYTFISEAHGSRRWLDHCVVTNAAWNVVVGVDIYYDIYWSDHFPLEIQCDLSMVRPKFELLNRVSINKVVWGQRDEGQIATYHDLCVKKLREINTFNEYIPCCDRLCYNLDHRKSIDTMYNKIVTSLSEAAVSSYNKGKCRKGVRIVGWNRHVKDAHRDARQKFINWVWHGKPIGGKLYKEMYESKKLFKQKLKFCQNNEYQIKMDMLVQKHKKKDFKNFWKQTKKVTPKPSIPVSIEGVNEPGEIANLFKEHFRVKSPNISSRTVSYVEDCQTGVPISFAPSDVFDIIKSMARGKSPGHDGLSIEHLLHAGPHLSGLLATFYTLCIRHSYLPEQLMRTIVVPIVKNKTGDISDKENYRPISLATIMAKVLDSLLERHLSGYLKLHDAQFGFKKSLSTESAILTLKHTVGYYTNRKTPIYAAFLDLSKAFDLVNYDILWKKLRDVVLPSELIEIFKYWYGHQLNQVRWTEVLSDEYRLECGVRQGGRTSPALFNLYINQLIVELSNTGVGCSIDGHFVNSISYADDMVLLSPSINALRILLNVCDTYAETHGLIYNVKKSVLLVFRAGSKIESIPPVKLRNVQLNRVFQFRYLGHVLTEDLTDDADIERERRALAVRCNMLSRSFARCTEEVKITLFKAFCQSFYTCSLWVKYTQRAYNALRVQYNNAFRVLMGLPRYCSASGMFTVYGTDDFHAIIRKRIASLLRRVRGSSNSILRAISDKFDCPILGHWMRMHLHVPGVMGCRK
ncbi:unnamed protein product [Parnassius mnemosyne]|uniref:Reverse transcriptase domain-containing protein n=1 Tax=Parnassius mnemosyne TaxID=213953 RepID=A0AAV1LLS9_9NEOP